MNYFFKGFIAILLSLKWPFLEFKLIIIYRADKWIMPPSRPISPTEQLNMLSWLNTEESRHIPEPKKEEIEVTTSSPFFVLLLYF